MAAVGFEPRTSRSGVWHSTTEPLRSPTRKWWILLRLGRCPGWSESLLFLLVLSCSGSYMHLLFNEMKGLSDQIWAVTWQTQQNGMCAQQKLRSAWASAQSDQSSLSAWRKLESLVTHWAHREDSKTHWADAQADLSLHWAHTHLLVLSCRGSYFVYAWLTCEKFSSFKGTHCSSTSSTAPVSFRILSASCAK